MWYWLSNERMTVLVKVDEDDKIRTFPPIARRFVGQPLENLALWMNEVEGFRIEDLGAYSNR